MKTLYCTVTLQEMFVIKNSITKLNNASRRWKLVLGGNWSCLTSRILLTAFKPEILSMPGNILTISKLTNQQRDKLRR